MMYEIGEMARNRLLKIADLLNDLKSSNNNGHKARSSKDFDNKYADSQSLSRSWG